MSGLEFSRETHPSMRLTENDKKEEKKNKEQKENEKNQHLKAKIGEKRKEMAKERAKKSEKSSESKGVSSKKAKMAGKTKEVPAVESEVKQEVEDFPSTISNSALNSVEIKNIHVIKPENQYTVITSHLLTRQEQLSFDAAEALTSLGIEAPMSWIECQKGKPVAINTKDPLFAIHFICTDALAREINSFMIDLKKNRSDVHVDNTKFYGVSHHLSREELVGTALLYGSSKYLDLQGTTHFFTPTCLIVSSEDGVREISMKNLIEDEFISVFTEASKMLTRSGTIGVKNYIKKMKQ